MSAAPNSKIITSLEAIAQPVCAAHGIDLVLVNYGREPAGAVLRVVIERPGMPVPEPGSGKMPVSGVTVDDCKNISRDLSAALDVNEDAIPGNYRLEVSSPGLERPLVKLNDYERFTGFEAAVKTRAKIGNRKNFEGHIGGVEGETITLTKDGEAFAIPFQEITKANLIYRF